MTHRSTSTFQGLQRLMWRLWFRHRSHSVVTSEPLLSKSKYLVGLQCRKALWIHYHQRELLPPLDSHTQAIFAQGQDVGAWAKKLFPGGIDLSGWSGFDAPVWATQRALRKPRPIFEAAFVHNGCFSRADILVPVGDGSWEIVEVKSSGAPESPEDVRAVYLEDLAFQHYVYTGAGLQIGRCLLLLINRKYVRSGAIDPAKLFQQVDVTAEVLALSPKVPNKVAQMRQTLASPTCPEIRISPHCSKPYECSLTAHCRAFLPPSSVLNLVNGGKSRWELLGRNILRLEDVPEDVILSQRQQRQVSAHRTGAALIDHDAVRSFLAGLTYPLHFLDFETIQSAVPFFDRSRPFLQIPFQFSLHVVNGNNAPAVHFGFVASNGSDPRPHLLSQLQKSIGPTGSVIGYNIAFELARLRECAEFFPNYADWIAGLADRFVDLLDLFRSMAYYDPAQNGSASLKAVLPALTGISYDRMEIGDGGTASREFLRITFGRVSRRERQRVRAALEVYCARDTYGLLEIIRKLEELQVAEELIK